MKVHHIGLWVNDLAAAGRFYDHVLGFEKQYDYQVPAEIVSRIFGRHSGCQVEVYRRDEVTLELFRPAGKIADRRSPALAPGINHFSLRVENKRAFCQQAREKGAQVIQVHRKDHCVYFIRDPEGILIEIKDR